MACILLDGGSQATLLREGVLPKTTDDLYEDHDLILVGGSKISKKLRVLDCHNEDIEGNWSGPITVTEIDKPCDDAPIIHPEKLQQYDYLNNVDVRIAHSETIDVLLGVDNIAPHGLRGVHPW